MKNEKATEIFIKISIHVHTIYESLERYFTQKLKRQNLYASKKHEWMFYFAAQ